MSTGPQAQKRPADVIGNAVEVMQIATGKAGEEHEDDGKNRAAAELGRKGGKARARKMCSERRAEIARTAAQKRRDYGWCAGNRRAVGDSKRTDGVEAAGLEPTCSARAAVLAVLKTAVPTNSATPPWCSPGSAAARPPGTDRRRTFRSSCRPPVSVSGGAETLLRVASSTIRRHGGFLCRAPESRR